MSKKTKYFLSLKQGQKIWADYFLQQVYPILEILFIDVLGAYGRF